MKKVISLLLSFLMFVSISSSFDFSAHAEYDDKEEYFYKILDDGTVQINSYRKNYSEVYVPSKINGRTVSRINDQAFYNRDGVTKVFIPETIVSIGDGAFEDCDNLAEINIPQSVNMLGDCVFYNCVSLSEITIPGSISEIGTSVFFNCKSLRNLKISYGVEAIGRDAFTKCSALTEIVLPDSVISIGNYAFSGCSSLDTIDLPDSIRKIGYSAFDNTAYYNNSDNWLSSSQTYNSQDILYIGNHLIHAGKQFEDSPNNEVYEIRKGTITIADFAFSDYFEREIVNIPDSVISIGECTFSSNSYIYEINVDENNEQYSSVNGVLFNKSKSEILAYPKGKESTEYIIPKETTIIGERAFYGCSNLASVTIGNSVTSIGDYAFYGCSNLASVTIPESVTCIGNSAFSDCSSLTSITIGNSVTSIGEFAFSDCSSLTSITIPESVINIGDYAFYGCSNLASVTIPESVTCIGDCAFAWCTDLSNISMPENIKSIGGSAFYNTAYYNDKSNWDNGALYFSVYILGTEEGMTELTIKEGTTVISNNCCSKTEDTLTSVVMPNSVEYIGDQAFYDCEKLSEISLSEKTKSIGKKAFLYCAFKSINIPVTVEYIGQTAFGGHIITDIYYGGTRSQWESLTFGKAVTSESLTVHCLGECELGNHNWDNGLITEKSTCTKTGTILYTCLDCGKKKTEEKPLLSHSYNYEVILKPTCTTTGIRLRTCTKCGATDELIIKKSEHILERDEAIVPTCTKTGLTEGSHCCVCNTIIVEQETVDALGHNYKTTTAKATTSKNGSSVTKCTVCGAVKSKSTIYYPKTISLSATSYTYNGKVKTPAVTVKNSKGKTLKKNTDYTVTYASGRKNVGKYAVKITFKGNYSGTKTLYFYVKPKATSISSVSAGSKKFTVKWKKQATQTTGYQIQYSTSSKFTSKTTKTVSIKNYKYTSQVFSRLKGKTKYYVRIRAYKTVKNINYYSAWSKAKAVTTKK